MWYPTDIEILIAKRLSIISEQSKKSDAELAHFLGMESEQDILPIKEARTEISVSCLADIARFYEISVDYFIHQEISFSQNNRL